MRDDDGAWRVARPRGRAGRRHGRPHQRRGDGVRAATGFRTMGVERALARAGAREGDLVRIGPVELEYVEGSDDADAGRCRAS